MNHKYKLAVSYANVGHESEFVDDFVKLVRKAGVQVFYDKDCREDYWGEEGDIFFSKAFKESEYCLIFASKEYNKRIWTMTELRGAREKILSNDMKKVLVARFDDVDLEGISKLKIYIDIFKDGKQILQPVDLSNMLLKKIGINQNNLKMSNIPPYKNKNIRGEVCFRYDNHNGIYNVGNGLNLFELRFSKASDTSIYICNNPASISGLALSSNANKFSEIEMPTRDDFSSWVRTVNIGGFAIFKNCHDKYCAIKIKSIKNSSRNDNKDEVCFDFRIQEDGTCQFDD